MPDQARRSLREELLTIPGISGAAFEGDDAQPTGVKVRLAPGADPDEVGRRVRRVLAGHGMRSQLTAPAVAPRTPPPPPEPRTVINLSDFEPGSGRAVSRDDEPATVAEPAEDEASAGESSGSASESAMPDVPDTTASEDVRDTGDAVPATEPDAATPVVALSDPVPVLSDVAVRQHGADVTVVVSVGGRSAERRAAGSRSGLDRAILAAVCELMDVSPEPELIEVASEARGGTTVISVVLDDGVTRRAGAAVDRGNRAWAVARALWSAVSGPA